MRIEQWIEQGLLKPGERLRSVRAGAAEHGVSKNTMAEAYDRLVAQGLLEARRGSGYYVSRIARPVFDELQPHVVEAIDTVSFLREQLEQNQGARVGDGRPPPTWMEGSELGKHLKGIRTNRHAGFEHGYGSPWGFAPLRERIAFFRRDDPDELIRARIAAEPFSTYPVCDGDIDHVVGYVDAKDLFQRALKNQPISLAEEGLVRKVLIVPDRLSLAEVLAHFRQVHEDFAVIVNEYSRVVGVVTLNDVMSTVMGDLVGPADEEQIVRRDENSWLIDGTTPIEDVLHALGIDEPPHADDYDTLAGFLMVMLRRVPRRTDRVLWDGCRFEVMDVDNYRIDQVLVTREAAGAGFR